MESRRNVVYISEAQVPSYAASSIHAMKMCQAMVQKGHQVTLCVPNWPVRPEFTAIDIWRHYGVAEKFPIRHFPWIGRWGGGHLFALLTAIYIRRLCPDLVYCRSLAAALWAARCGFPVIYELHAIPPGLTAKFLLKLLSQSRYLKGMVFITRILYQDFIMTHPFLSDFQPVIIAPDGVDLERFKPTGNNSLRERLEIPSNAFVAGYAGHFYPGKGLELIERLAMACPDFRFLVMGGMPEEVERLVGQSRRAGSGNILYTGFIANIDLPDYLSICDVLLLPNKERMAGFGGGSIGRWTSPMKLFEYMAAGRVILASDLPVLREILNESNAIFCDPNDIESWRQTIIYAERNESLCKKIGTQARQDVEQYTWIHRVDRCLLPVFKAITEMRKI